MDEPLINHIICSYVVFILKNNIFDLTDPSAVDSLIQTHFINQ